MRRRLERCRLREASKRILHQVIPPTSERVLRLLKQIRRAIWGFKRLLSFDMMSPTRETTMYTAKKHEPPKRLKLVELIPNVELELPGNHVLLGREDRDEFIIQAL